MINKLTENSIYTQPYFTGGLPFEKLGEIVHISEVVPENQLRGYFTLEGQKSTIKISFTLTPQNPALVQTFKIEEI